MPDIAFQPDWFSRPGDTLLTLMEQNELTSDDVANQVGCSIATIQGVLSGLVPIDQFIATGLSKAVGGTARFWSERQEKYSESLAYTAGKLSDRSAEDWLKQFPHSDIKKYGWISSETPRKKLLATYLAYFGVGSPDEWENRYAGFLKQTAFRASRTAASKAGSLSAWLRRGEIEAASVRCSPWDPDKLRKNIDALRVLTKSRRLEYFLPKIRSLCADAGVAVVFVRAPAGCSASGAARFISPEKAMIILSFRYLTDDHFWFTFFHEVAHLILHSSSLTFIDGEELASDDLEDEANRFSENVLIPISHRERLMDIRPTRDAIIRFALSVGVSPGIIVGQMQHHKVIGQNQMNHLKRRFDWETIQHV